jgi:hypothetical protein
MYMIVAYYLKKKKTVLYDSRIEYCIIILYV